MHVSTLCVFCSSSDALETHYFDLAKQLGEALAQRKISLVYGGAHVGVMKHLALAVQKNNGKVHGIIPRIIFEKGIAYEQADELTLVDDMAQRKQIMENEADAFVALPGGIGTLDEVFEMLALKQLGQHNKPIVLLDSNGFYATLRPHLDKLVQENFIKQPAEHLYHFSAAIDEMFEYLEGY
ncbi:MAG TPA: TIGR00730 family Rossman fold protein [Caldithrix abyssi]|uniref:Cytokinin riboside 5'-monophosphate phosphoribohydrolase n=1 Tax=Caldithrix abyssi TaxID=187145 RepID=A0A7V4U2W8_CALAY|nr:TIGR00730 family Rossman fold protein [Caldithrix abyssi]